MRYNQTLTYDKLSFSNPLIVDYYKNVGNLKQLYGNAPDIEGLQSAAKSRVFSSERREILHKVLEEQHQSLHLHPSQMEHINDILDPNTRTVTTGHQLCLFTGPLYTIYKIVSTIKLTQVLNVKSSEMKYVPVYWLASEDHDFDEVNHAHIFNNTIVWDRPKGDAVGRMTLEGMDKVLKQWFEVLGDSTNAEDIKRMLSEAYASGNNLAQATRILIHELFKDYGLLILDGDSPLLKKEFIPIVKQELLDNDYYNLVNESGDALVKAGYKKQVNPREINLFYLYNGSRSRITKSNNSYQLDTSGENHTESEVLQLLASYPERFSPNVIMRPLFQEMILPNIAYIGGGGELSYWFQLKKGFEHFNLPFPVLLLRNSATVIDQGSWKKMSKLQLSPADIFKDTESLLKQHVMAHTAVDLRLTKEVASLNDLYDQILVKSGAIDPSIQQFVRGEHKRAIKSVEVIEKKMLQAEKKKQEVGLNQIRGLNNKLFPNKGLQERYNNFFQYYLSEGADFIRIIIDTFDPLITDHYVFNLGDD